jgi:hypothetical protein
VKAAIPPPGPNVFVARTSHAFDNAVDECSRSAADYFWRRGGGLPRRLEDEVATRLADLFSLALGDASHAEPTWTRRTDIFGDGTNGYDVVWQRFRPDLVIRVRELLRGPYERFSVVLYFYDRALGRGFPRCGAMWLDGAQTIVTESVAENLPVDGRER